MSRGDDPAAVREEYRTDESLSARQSIYANRTGPDPFAVALEAVREVAPRRVLELGGGQGTFAERLVRELGVELVGVDQSEGMVALQRSRGIDARLGDAQQLPFEDSSFDSVVALWMLYHVANRPRAFREIVRVLRPGGRLVAITNGVDHLRELCAAIGRSSLPVTELFSCENGRDQLAPFFARVERRDVVGEVLLSNDQAQTYVDATMTLGGEAELSRFDEPLRVRTVNCVLVAQAPG